MLNSVLVCMILNSGLTWFACLFKGSIILFY